MRVRPFFWFLLLSTCMVVIAFSLLYQPHAPSSLQVRVEQHHLVSNSPASLEINLTDPHGIPVDQATVTPTAWMPNMAMQTPGSTVKALGNGRYQISIHLAMAGPWAIKIRTDAFGFAPQQQTLFVQVT